MRKVRFDLWLAPLIAAFVGIMLAAIIISLLALAARGDTVEIKTSKATGTVLSVVYHQPVPGMPGIWVRKECRKQVGNKTGQRWVCATRSTGQLEVRMEVE